VREVMRHGVVLCDADVSTRDVARTMRDHRAGTVLAVDLNSEVIGVIDEAALLRGWSDPDQTTAAPQDAANGLQIELPYEQVGQVTVTGTRRLLATQILMSLAGSGPAPF